ncbi:MAG: sulfotransferase family protein, partial [Actinomycetota bacterium]
PIPFSEIAADLRATPPSSYPDAIRQIFRVCAQKQGKSRYGNKSPVHVRGLPMLAELFPEARFIHIIRDGRNVALSYMDVDFGPSTIEGGALRWRRHVTDGRKAGATLGPERYREVRYEHLIDDPESAIRDLCGFIGIAFDERMLRYYERSEQLYPGRQTPDHHRNLARPPTKGMRSWREEMTAAQVAMFEAVAGGLVEELGYERGAPRAGPGRRLRAKARLIALRIQAGMRRVGLSKRKPSGGARKRD